MARIIQTADLDPQADLSQNDNDWIYNGLDNCVTLEVLKALEPQLDDTSRATYEFSKALQAPVMEMNMRGLLVDKDRRKEVLKRTRKDIAQLEDQYIQLVRDGIGIIANSRSWASHVQVKHLLYDVLGIKPVRKRNTDGAFLPTVNEEALEELQGQYFLAEPLCAHILKLRDLDKQRQTLETGIDPDGRFRTQFNIAGTNTGRLSSAESVFDSGGNLQNQDKRLREVFVADPGYKFGNLDLEQADSRNLGASCWEAFVETHGEDFAGSYLDICESTDLHTFVTKISAPHLEWGTSTDREIADRMATRIMSYRDCSKRLGHGSNYLGAPPTMAKKSHLPLTNVQEFQQYYFNRFKCIPSYHEWVANELRTNHCLTTLLGRRRYFFDRAPAWDLPKSKLHTSSTLREAVAFCPQSMTADEISQGMLNVWRQVQAQLLLQVHDSILIQFPEHLENEIIPFALECLRITIALKKGRSFTVPTEAKTGWNYGDYKGDKNPDGLKTWKGEDNRKRQRTIH